MADHVSAKPPLGFFFFLIILFTLLLLTGFTTFQGEAWHSQAPIDPEYYEYLPLIQKSPCEGSAGIYGVAFHDLNGNGIRDHAYAAGSLADHPDGYLGKTGPFYEPGIANVLIDLDGSSATSDTTGFYEICLVDGTYSATISAEPYRYLLESNASFKSLSDNIPVTISGLSRVDLGLGVGFATLPYGLDDSEIYRQGSLVDIDPIEYEVGVYNDYPEDCDWWHCTGDAHRGNDYYAPAGTTVVSIGPGLVYSVGNADDGSLMIVIVHTEYEGLTPYTGPGIRWANQGIESGYSHLDTAAPGIVPGAMVQRGQPIAYLVETIFGPHIHFDLQWWQVAGVSSSGGYVDPYRDLYHGTFEFKTHDTSYGYSIKISWGSPGYWTADNQPHFTQ